MRRCRRSPLPTVPFAEDHHRVHLLRDDGLVRVGPDVGRGISRGSSGIPSSARGDRVAETDVDLHWYLVVRASP